MKILNFGSCNIDYVYSLDHIVEEGETETSHSLELFPGGKGLNQSIAISKAGANVYHAGCVGNDSAMLTDILSKNKVDISLIRKTDAKNGHAIIQLSKSGNNSIFLYPGTNEMIDKEYIDSVLENFETGDIILLQNEISNIDYIIKKASEKNMCIILNPSPFNEKLEKIDFNNLSYIILNEIEARAFSDLESIEDFFRYCLNKYPRLKIMLTLGSKGCIYKDSDNEIYHPAFKVEAVDTTAAGDTFTGYFVAGVSRGEDYNTILKTATIASAISVTRKGAATSIPCLMEVIQSKDVLTKNNYDSKIDLLTKQIDVYIDNNICSITLENLAEFLGYSTVYTGNLVKKLTGKSFSRLIQSKRCKMAAKQLLNSNLSIKEIINNVGYENESFFRKIFKEKYGQTPFSYRRNGGIKNDTE